MNQPHESIIGLRIDRREELIARFGMSARLAVRIVALLKCRVALTETVIETACEEQSLRSTLLDASLLDENPPLQQGRMRQIARAHGWDMWELLHVVERSDGWRVVALKDDILADGTDGAPHGDVGLTLPGTPGPIRAMQHNDIFSPRDIARIKMDALAGQDVKQRIEAVRKLVYTPEPSAGKAGVLIQVLVDETADRTLRKEALRALESMGLSRELSEPLARLFNDKSGEVPLAVRHIGLLLADLDDAQTGVVLAVLLELLERTDSVETGRALIKTLSGQAAVIALNNHKFFHFMRMCLSLLRLDFARTCQDVAAALRACRSVSPPAVQECLEQELERTSDTHVTTFLLGHLADPEAPAARTSSLAGAAVGRLVSGGLCEDQAAYLKRALVRLGEPAIDAVAGAMGTVKEPALSELISLLDTLLSRCEARPDTAASAAGALLQQLKTSGADTGRRILETSLITDPRIPDGMRASIAGEVLTHIAEFGMDNTHQDIHDVLRRLGGASILPMLKYLQRTFPAGDADRVFITLGETARTAERPDPEAVRQAIEYCHGLLRDSHSDSGKFCVALAGLCGDTAPGAERLDELLDDLHERLWTSPYTFDVIEALAILSGSGNIRPEHQQRIFSQFARITTLQTAAAIGRQRSGEDGIVFEFGKNIDFETVVIPNVIKGLERIGIHQNTPDRLRTDVVRRLLVLWEGVSRMRMVWSPAAVGTLVNAIGAVASSARVPDDLRARLGGALLHCMNKTSVVKNLGDIFAAPEISDRMTALALNAAEALRREWTRARDEDNERRTAILGSIGTIAANDALDPHDPRVRSMRESALDILFQGLRAGTVQVRDDLDRLSRCRGLTGQQRADIQAGIQSV